MDRRTTLITAAAVTGVVLAGTTAIAANIGILDATDNDNVGELSATAVVETVPVTVPTELEPQVIDVYIEDPPPASISTVLASSDVGSQAHEFKVDSAGAVLIERTDDGILLDGVTANLGWQWASTQPSPTELTVTFTSDDAEYVFIAGVAEDGSIVARVDQPIVNIVQAPAVPTASVPARPATTPAGDGYDDEHDDHDDDDHDDDDHDDDDDEHEGSDDDD